MTTAPPPPLRRGTSGAVVRIALGLTFVAGLFGIVGLLVGLEHAGTATSPDGTFIADVSYRRFEALVPRGPGGGRDKPGRLEVRRVADGRSCGGVPVPMVWLVDDLRWDLASTPKTVVLIGVARWNLDACNVDTSGW